MKISNQLLKSGTSFGANVKGKLRTVESKADFIHKFKIAAKSCFDETDINCFLKKKYL